MSDEKINGYSADQLFTTWPRQFALLLNLILKFIYSEKAAKFCEIFHILLTTVYTVKSKGVISQSFVAFSEYMNFN